MMLRGIGFLFWGMILTLMWAGCEQAGDGQAPKTADSVAVLNDFVPEKAPIAPNRVLNVGFLVLDSVYNSELFAPWDIFHHTIFHTDPGMRVFSVAKSPGLLTTFEGVQFQPDYTFENAPAIDILAVPSALHNLDSDLEDEAVINFVRQKGDSAMFLISFCDGAFVLAQAGLLDGLHCTTFPGDIDKFEIRFAKTNQLDVHREVIYVADGKAITSAGGARSYDPAMYLVERLYGRKVADGIAGGMVIDWNPEKIPHFIAAGAK